MARALFSVSDKSGVAAAARRLADAGLEIVATGGTSRTIQDAGIPVTDVSDVTGFPEIMDGRVKTLHPAIHGGLLARRDHSGDIRALSEHGIEPIDVLVSNLYPFASVVGADYVDDSVAIENIDIGGPAMIRAAAKNHRDVIVMIDPEDYEDILAAIEANGVSGVDERTRRHLAAKAFRHVSHYDSLVSRYLAPDEPYPEELTLGGRLISQTKYGENPHQSAAVYALSTPGPASGISTWSVFDDKDLSYNNYLDASAAWGCVSQFSEPAAVIVKHTLPCGVGVAGELPEAFEKALSGDPVSAFGGILATNQRIDLATVEAIGKLRLDVMITPGYEDDALESLRSKRNLRIIEVGNTETRDTFEVRSIPGGLLIQESDDGEPHVDDWRVVTNREPTNDELRALEFAWRVVPWVKSNAIVLAQDGAVTGIGAGQPNRVESVRIAARVAGERAAGSVLASDAFFPFPDGIEEAAAAGVTAIAQPGGSVRDDACIEAANAAGIAMVLTGRRHFRH